MLLIADKEKRGCEIELQEAKMQEQSTYTRIICARANRKSEGACPRLSTSRGSHLRPFGPYDP